MMSEQEERAAYVDSLEARVDSLEQALFHVMDARIAQLEQALQEMERKANAACKIYCGWYDHGVPDYMDGRAVAYEMVSCLRRLIKDAQAALEE